MSNREGIMSKPIEPPAISAGIEVANRAARESAYRALSEQMAEASYFRLPDYAGRAGRAATCLAATDRTTIAVKLYVAGGERAVHRHSREDHTFIVLRGRVRFGDGGGRSIVLETGCGVLIPRGVAYNFHIESDESAVMLRVGARAD
jgi:mannose-6-phosphate isomerase-like protein (cupin superfamily)